MILLGRPERDGTFGGRGDAIVERAGRALAVEHTTVDFLLDQRKHRERFYRVIAPLEEAVVAALPEWNSFITVPFGAIPEGVRWEDLRDRLVEGCVAELRRMRPGPPRNTGREVSLAGVPFTVRLAKWKPRRRGRCWVSNGISAAAADGGDLRASIRDRAMAKSGKLDELGRQGLRKVLLLDSDEIDAHGLADAFAASRGEAARSGMDDIWVCFTPRFDACWFWPVKLDERIYPEVPEFEASWRAQYPLVYPE